MPKIPVPGMKVIIPNGNAFATPLDVNRVEDLLAGGQVELPIGGTLEVLKHDEEDDTIICRVKLPPENLMDRDFTSEVSNDALCSIRWEEFRNLQREADNLDRKYQSIKDLKQT